MPVGGMKVAAIQLCSGVDIAQNLAQAGALIRAAAADGAKFIATPEMTHILQRSPKRLFAAIATEAEDKGCAYFSALAKELEIYLLIGSLAILVPEAQAAKGEDGRNTQDGKKRAVNRSFLYGPDGVKITHYDKIHLFDVQVSRAETWKESAVYDRGNTAVITSIGADIESAKLGLSICYDLRFAGLYRAYAQAGAQILAVPAAFTKPTGAAHWQTLLRARAIETGSFVIAPAQGGSHEDGRTTFGHSLIIGPWGQVIAEIDGDEPGFITADIDLDEVSQARAKIPAWQHDPDYDISS